MEFFFIPRISINQKKYQLKLSIKSFFASASFAFIVMVFMHWLSYHNSGELSFQPVVVFISVFLFFVPVLSVLKHRKYRITIDGSTISGYDLILKKRVSKKYTSITSFGIVKASTKERYKHDLALVDHVYIDLTSGERLVIFLKENNLKELLADLEKFKLKKSDN